MWLSRTCRCLVDFGLSSSIRSCRFFSRFLQTSTIRPFQDEGISRHVLGSRADAPRPGRLSVCVLAVPPPSPLEWDYEMGRVRARGLQSACESVAAHTVPGTARAPRERRRQLPCQCQAAVAFDTTCTALDFGIRTGGGRSGRKKLVLNDL